MGLNCFFQLVSLTLPHLAALCKQQPKHTVTVDCNQTQLCDYRQKICFSCLLSAVGWCEDQCARRLWCMLGSLNRALLSPADRLYINVIHQAAFTDMTSVVQRGLAGHNAHIKHLCSASGIKESASMKSSLKATSLGKWWFDFKNKYLENEPPSMSERAKNQDIPPWS